MGKTEVLALSNALTDGENDDEKERETDLKIFTTCNAESNDI
jgi:hypothetical protein